MMFKNKQIICLILFVVFSVLSCQFQGQDQREELEQGIMDTAVFFAPIMDFANISKVESWRKEKNLNQKILLKESYSYKKINSERHKAQKYYPLVHSFLMEEPIFLQLLMLVL